MSDRPPQLSPVDEELRAYVESRPPPAALETARAQVVARFRDPTKSSLDLVDDMQRQMLEFAMQSIRENAIAQRRTAMLKQFAWPTALVTSIFLVGYFVLLALRIDVPKPVLVVIGAITTLVAAALPKLVGGGTGAAS